MKRILHIYTQFPPMAGGTATQNYNVVKHLHDAGVNPEVIYVRRKVWVVFDFVGTNVEYASYPAYITVVDINSLSNPITIAQLVFLLTRRIDKHTIVSTDAKPFLIFLLALLKIVKRFPLTIRVGGHVFYELRSAYRMAIRESPSLMKRVKYNLSCMISCAISKFALKICAIIFVDGYDITESLMAEGISGEKIVVIYNGVDLTKFSEGNITDIALRPTDKTVIMFIGRLIPENGPLEFLRIIGTFSKTCDDFLGVVLSEGPLRREMDEYVKATGLNEKVLFLGFVPDDELPSYLAAVDILLLPLQRIGGVSQVVTESMAMGKPVITTNVGDVAKIVEHGVNGFIYDKDDLEGMCNMLQRLATDKGLRERVGGNAHRFIRENYGWEKIIKEYFEVYEKL
jgi:glycosyltransferase involved in cell wall biosynthesis